MEYYNQLNVVFAFAIVFLSIWVNYLRKENIQLKKALLDYKQGELVNEITKLI